MPNAPPRGKIYGLLQCATREDFLNLKSGISQLDSELLDALPLRFLDYTQINIKIRKYRKSQEM
jgi:hypothetical protein